MFIKVFLKLFITTLFILDCHSDERLTENIHIYSGSDFEEVVKTSLFIDKTLLIKRFFDNAKHGLGILLLAPRHYGKSTNMNMLKRFFEITVDANGEKKRPDETSSYNIFRNNYLNIYKLNPFFSKSFGKYPVISIDYQPLSEVESVEAMLAVFFRIIMKDTFVQYRYLLHDPHLWSLNVSYEWVDKDRFDLYVNEEKHRQLKESDIETGFSFLAKLLHTRYEERVTVLIDNYDAFVESPLFRQNSDVFHLIRAVNSDLLRCESVERSLITGLIRSSEPRMEMGDILPSNVVPCRADHKMWQYYGLRGNELDQLLQPIVRDDEEREKVIGKITQKYSGYSVATFEVGEDRSGQILDSQMCSVWSLVQYLEEELAVENFSSIV